MKLPSWYTMTLDRAAGNYTAAQYTMRVKKWHPGYWWALVRSLKGVTFTIRIGRSD